MTGNAAQENFGKFRVNLMYVNLTFRQLPSVLCKVSFIRVVHVCH